MKGRSRARFPNTFWIFLALVVIAGSWSCKKDKDEKPPEVFVVAPFEYQSYDVFDDLVFTVTCKDETQLESITLELVNEALINVLPGELIVPTENEVTITDGFNISDIHLESGRYYAKVTASDGTNETKRYVEIHINGVALDVNHILAVTNPANTVEFRSVDASGTNNFYHAVATDFGGVAVSSYDQQLLTMGQFTGPLEAVTAETFAILWSKPAGSNLPDPYWEYLYRDDQRRITFAINTLGDIRGYNGNGTITVSALSLGGHLAKKVRSHGDYVLSSQKQNGVADWKLVLNYYSTGVYHQDLPLPGELIDLHPRDETDLFLFCNVAGEGKILLYNIDGNSYWDAKTISAGNIIEVVAIDEENYIIAHQDGISFYAYSTNSLIPFFTGVTYIHIAYDDVNNHIIGADNSNVYFWDLAGNTLQTIPMADAPLELLVLYNK